ncbi:uncharacterized protein LOC127844280 [Dreissena polymorpha]|uniref:uncharacterized protein LOC127844280 n=1 Tax=Dreissena polymorpha TaxID=45954 RepID=UPI00226484C2|nr:uncharacterized protein LOC127844280 [Dreissena polymorpha]
MEDLLLKCDVHREEKLKMFCQDHSQLCCSDCVLMNHRLQFISVTNGQLMNGRKLSLQHAAYGIAHHQGALYVTSDTALYHYTLTGTLVNKLHKDAEASYRVCRCAVSPSGDRIYVTNFSQHKLLTLATNGTLISTFDHSELQGPWGVHVAPAGQVLVCGFSSNTMVQLDREGSKKLATLASQRDGLIQPVSVCYNTNIHQIIVGRINSKVIVMNLQ